MFRWFYINAKRFLSNDDPRPCTPKRKMKNFSFFSHVHYGFTRTDLLPKNHLFVNHRLDQRECVLFMDQLITGTLNQKVITCL
jgi:hypothetical protein